MPFVGNILRSQDCCLYLLKRLSNLYRTLDRAESSHQVPISMVCDALDISRSSYYDYHQRWQHIDVKRHGFSYARAVKRHSCGLHAKALVESCVVVLD